MSRIKSRTRSATSPLNADRRYFVIHTKCKWISNTLPDWDSKTIHPVCPSRRRRFAPNDIF